jgi:hypothetical protein
MPIQISPSQSDTSLERIERWALSNCPTNDPCIIQQVLTLCSKEGLLEYCKEFGYCNLWISQPPTAYDLKELFRHHSSYIIGLPKPDSSYLSETCFHSSQLVQMGSIPADVNQVLLEALFPNPDGPPFWSEVPDVHFMDAKMDSLRFSSESTVAVGSISFATVDFEDTCCSSQALAASSKSLN